MGAYSGAVVAVAVGGQLLSYYAIFLQILPDFRDQLFPFWMVGDTVPLLIMGFKVLLDREIEAPIMYSVIILAIPCFFDQFIENHGLTCLCYYGGTL